MVAIVMHAFVYTELQCIHTVDVERFSGLNVHGFNNTEVVVEILLHCLG